MENHLEEWQVCGILPLYCMAKIEDQDIIHLYKKFYIIFNPILPLSVRICITLVTNVSAPLGQLSTNVNSSGDCIPIPLT
jgi:hypothetical protein